MLQWKKICWSGLALLSGCVLGFVGYDLAEGSISVQANDRVANLVREIPVKENSSIAHLKQEFRQYRDSLKEQGYADYEITEQRIEEYFKDLPDDKPIYSDKLGGFFSVADGYPVDQTTRVAQSEDQDGNLDEGHLLLGPESTTVGEAKAALKAEFLK